MPSWNILYLIYNIFQHLKLYLQKLCVPSEMVVRILLQWISCQPDQDIFFRLFSPLSKDNFQLSEKRFYNKTKFYICFPLLLRPALIAQK